jgi:hypothetical protein
MDQPRSLVTFVLTVNVTLNAPEAGPTPDPKDDIVGYWGGFGVTAVDLDDAVALVSAYIADGVPDWSDYDYANVRFWELPALIRRQSGDPDRRGIWFVMGKSCYTREGV